MPKNLTIVIPHFNSPDSLKVLLESIGVHDDVDVIVVDDNSTKYLEELEACKNEFSVRGVRFLRNDSGEKNAGAARNVGLDAADSRWIIFSDADDYFVDGWYDVASSYFEDSEHDIIHFMVSEQDSRYNQQNVKKAVLRYNLLCEAWLRGLEHADSMIRIYFYAPWSKMIRLGMLREHDVRFQSIRVCNDILFSTKAGYYADKVTVCREPIYFHVTNDSSLSTNRTEEWFCTKQIAYCDRCDFLNEKMDAAEWRAVNNNEGLRRLFIAAKRRYGIRNIWKYYRMYKAHHVPVFTLRPDEITRLKRMIRASERK